MIKLCEEVEVFKRRTYKNILPMFKLSPTRGPGASMFHTGPQREPRCRLSPSFVETTTEHGPQKLAWSFAALTAGRDSGCKVSGPHYNIVVA